MIGDRAMNIFNKELKLTNELKTDFLRIFYYDFEENYKAEKEG